jgi:hypothetical protein
MVRKKISPCCLFQKGTNTSAFVRHLFLYGFFFRLSLHAGPMATMGKDQIRDPQVLLQLLNPVTPELLLPHAGPMQEWANIKSKIRRFILQLLNSCNS